MAERTVDPVYVPLTVTTPPGVTDAAPQITPWPLPNGVIEQLWLMIPYGHIAVTGVRLTISGQQVFPWSAGASWIVGEDVRDTFDMTLAVSGGLAVETYNAGVYPHTHYLRAKVRQLVTSVGAVVVPIIPNDQLGSGAA